MTRLSPTTLTRSDQLALHEVVKDRPREALIVSMALRTDLRLAELVGLDVGDVELPERRPRLRLQIRAEIVSTARRRRLPAEWAQAEACEVLAAHGRSA